MNIALTAQDKKKELLVQFCTAYKSILAKHNLFATATTGRLVADATGLPISLFLSHKNGGHQQIDARIAYNEIDLVLMFSDPDNRDPWEDQRIIETLRHCDKHNVPVGTNLASAEMLIMGLQRGDLDWREMIHPRRSVKSIR
ncbi:MAG: methylglyoxal synthase [Ruminococcaceae bacterium]|jgi:methylglyoxal synthase|nr:methylglyoxal synthase [Oscillospiraceae bacterium]